MILIYAPHKSTAAAHSGMHIRVNAVDDILSDKERIYFWEKHNITGSLVIKKVDDKCSIFEYNPASISHINKLYQLIEKCDYIYCHSLLNSYKISYIYNSGKCIIDLHGIAYDELVISGCISEAEIYKSFEKDIIEKSWKIISVTEAMAHYYSEKYNVPLEKFIILPVIDYSGEKFERNSINNNYIYSGDLSKWQNIDLMLSAIKKCRYEDNKYYLYSQEKEKLINLVNIAGLDNVFTGSFTKNEKDNIYKSMSFGFILRDDNDINRAACPTKLVEYMQYGIVPVVLSENIGDFNRLGYKYILIDDFINHNYSNDDCINIINTNYKIYEHIKQQFSASIKQLKNISITDSKSILYNQIESVILQQTYLYAALENKNGNKVYKTYLLSSIMQNIVINTESMSKLILYIPGSFYMDNIYINNKYFGKGRKIIYNIENNKSADISFYINRKQNIFEYLSVKYISFYYKLCKIVYIFKNPDSQYFKPCRVIKGFLKKMNVTFLNSNHKK